MVEQQTAFILGRFTSIWLANGKKQRIVAGKLNKIKN
jgi:hypothetical protein